MKKTNEDEKLNRLIQLAASGTPEVPPMAAKFPAEVLRRAWRRPENAEAPERYWLSGVRWGVAGAVVIMLASVFLNVRALRGAHVNSEAVFHQQLAELVLPDEMK